MGTIDGYYFGSICCLYFIQRSESSENGFGLRSASEPRKAMSKLRYFVCVLLDFFILQTFGMMILSIEDYTRADFPSDFVFGAGTSAYQVFFNYFFIYSFSVKTRFCFCFKFMIESDDSLGI